MGNESKSNNDKKMNKIVYFDEDSASDYLDIVNDGRLHLNQKEAKEKISKIIAKMDAQIGGGISFLNFFKAALQGSSTGSLDRVSKSIVEKQLSNTLLTDYVTTATNDNNIKKFRGIVYPPENSISKYKMYSPYTIIVPKDQMPIDLEKLNEALENARGYYEMLLDDSSLGLSVLRLNSKAFKNNYNLSDLTKMKLIFYAVKVGVCTLDMLDMSKEFDFTTPAPTAEDVLGVDNSNTLNDLSVYDVIIAGVENE